MSFHSIFSAARVGTRAHPGLRAVRQLPTAAALAGLAAAVAGLLLPWVTVLHGTVPLNGIAAGGGAIAGLAVASALVLAAAHRYGWPAGRWAAAVGASIAGAGSLWAAVSVADYTADPGPAALLASPAPGPGPWVLAAAAGVLVAAALRPLPRRVPGAGARASGLAARLGLGATAFVAGWIHVLLTPEHWAESALLGAGFLGAGLLQLALSIAVVERPGRAVHLALVVLNVALVAVWLYAVLVGLPFGDAHDHGQSAGWAIGAGEPVDGVALVAKAAELVGAVWAARLASHPIQRTPGSEVSTQPARHPRDGGPAATTSH